MAEIEANGTVVTEEASARQRLRDPALRRHLAERLPQTEICFDEPMSRHTSFRIGGPADALLLPRTLADLQECVRLARELALPLTVVGNGSNLLVRDGGIRGLVLKIAENLAAIERDGTRLRAEAGVPLIAVSRFAADHALTGLEFACGIPQLLKGEFSHKEEANEQNYLRREIRYGSFERQLRLPPTVDAEKASASFEHGMLRLVLPKKPEARARSIKITPQGVVEGQTVSNS